MTTLEIILSILLYFIVSVFCVFKQGEKDPYSVYNEGLGFIVFLFSPIFLLVAIIRHILFKPWK